MSQRKRRTTLLNNSLVPPGYHLVDYISANDNAYITTNIHLNSESCVCADVLFRGAGNTYGCYSGSTAKDNLCLYAGSTASAYVRWDGSIQRVFNPTAEVRYKIKHSYQGFYVDGVLYGTPFSDGSHNHFECSAPFRVGNLSNSNADKFKGRIYRVYVIDDGRITIDLRPCYDEVNEVYGLYDVVGQHFYESESSNFQHN